MRLLSILTVVVAVDGLAWLKAEDAKPATYSLHPIGRVEKAAGKTTIVLDKKLQPGLLGLDSYSHVYVLWWFDQNDTPEKRAILQVHPRGDAGIDKTVRLWDAQSGKELRCLEGHTQPVQSVAFSADGRRAISASQNSAACPSRNCGQFNYEARKDTGLNGYRSARGNKEGGGRVEEVNRSATHQHRKDQADLTAVVPLEVRYRPRRSRSALRMALFFRISARRRISLGFS